MEAPAATTAFREKVNVGAYGSRPASIIGLDTLFPIKPKSGVHCLRFSPAAGTPDIFRSVLVSNLTKTTSISQILDEVRGGRVVDVKLVNMDCLMNCSVALVQFLHEESAKRFVAYTVKNHIMVDKKRISATLIKTPTWPMLPYVRNSMLQGKCTRFLRIYKFSRDGNLSRLRQDIDVDTATKLSAIESIRMKDQGFVEICFTSVRGARMARDRLVADGRYRDCPVGFGPDPCAAPYPCSSDKPAQQGWVSEAIEDDSFVPNTVPSGKSVVEESTTESGLTGTTPVHVVDTRSKFKELEETHQFEE